MDSTLISIISSMFEELPRQGPGLDESTLQACSAIPPSLKPEKILDIGCGSGMQTLTLAKHFPHSQITASDLYQPFLDTLQKRAETAGLDGRIITHRASMDNLPFEEQSFDIIWAEGCAFIMGISAALNYWKKFVKPDGYLTFSDLTWFTDTPSDECRDFFDMVDPNMPSESETEEIIRTAGFTIINSFRLSDEGWWKHYYNPLSRLIPHLKEKYTANQDALNVIQGLQQEIEIRRKYPTEYGYKYYVLINKNPGT